MARGVLAAATVYVGLVFAAGFAFGALRILVTRPALGELTALLIELPVMLVISWFACAFCVRRYGLEGHSGGPTLAMGAIAFAMLMIAEVLLGFLLFGRSFDHQIASYGTPGGLLGLGGQAAFGVIPVLQSLLYRA